MASSKPGSLNSHVFLALKFIIIFWKRLFFIWFIYGKQSFWLTVQLFKLGLYYYTSKVPGQLDILYWQQLWKIYVFHFLFLQWIRVWSSITIITSRSRHVWELYIHIEGFIICGRGVSRTKHSRDCVNSYLSVCNISS